MNGSNNRDGIAVMADPFAVALDNLVDTWREQGTETPVLADVLDDVA